MWEGAYLVLNQKTEAAAGFEMSLKISQKFTEKTPVP